MAGKSIHKVQGPSGDDDEAQQNFDDEDEKTKQEMQDFQKWLDSTTNKPGADSVNPKPAASHEMPPPPAPAKKSSDCTCTSKPCISAVN